MALHRHFQGVQDDLVSPTPKKNKKNFILATRGGLGRRDLHLIAAFITTLMFQMCDTGVLCGLGSLLTCTFDVMAIGLYVPS